jgi:hypothetical protein
MRPVRHATITKDENMKCTGVSGVAFAAVLSLFLAAGCVVPPDQSGSDDIDDDAAGEVTQQVIDCNDSCGYWACVPTYSLCEDGTCQALGSPCTVETQQTDCVYMGCGYVPVCCPAN